MKKYFVTYHQAVALKELGYNPFMREDCLAYFNTSNSNHDLETKDWWCLPKNDFQYALSAPLKSQVFEWARDEYGLYHIIHHFEHKKDTNEEFLAEISGKLLMGNDDISKFSNHLTYEEAESACIDKLIEIVKNNLDK